MRDEQLRQHAARRMPQLDVLPRQLGGGWSSKAWGGQAAAGGRCGVMRQLKIAASKHDTATRREVQLQQRGAAKSRQTRWNAMRP